MEIVDHEKYAKSVDKWMVNQQKRMPSATIIYKTKTYVLFYRNLLFSKY